MNSILRCSSLLSISRTHFDRALSLFSKTRLVIRPEARNAGSRRYNYDEAAMKKEAEYLEKLLAENKSKTFKIYSCSSSGSLMFNMAGVFGGTLFLLISYVSWGSFSSARFQNRATNLETGFFAYILDIVSSSYFQVGVCSTIALLGLTMPFATMLITSRAVNQLYLLKGGESLALVTDGVFGKQWRFVFKLEETSFRTARKSNQPQILFQNKNHYFYFILNNLEGKFHDKVLFDNVICRKRF